MKYLYALLTVSLLGCTAVPAQSVFEARVLAELNLVRASPAAYAEILSDYRKLVPATRTGAVSIPGIWAVPYVEGRSAVDEAISILRAQRPLRPLTFSPGLIRAAQSHYLEQARYGLSEHSSRNGTTAQARIERFGTWGLDLGECLAYGSSTPRAIIIALLVDDGISSRIHRTTILNPAFRVVGIAVGAHPEYGIAAIIDFAGTFDSRAIAAKP
jgi:hypothetical protein